MKYTTNEKNNVRLAHLSMSFITTGVITTKSIYVCTYHHAPTYDILNVVKLPKNKENVPGIS